METRSRRSPLPPSPRRRKQAATVAPKPVAQEASSSLRTRPRMRAPSPFSIAEEDENESESSSSPRYLEGLLHQRRTRNRYLWKERYVVLDLLDGGTLTCFDAATIAASLIEGRSSSRGNANGSSSTLRSSSAVLRSPSSSRRNVDGSASIEGESISSGSAAEENGRLKVTTHPLLQSGGEVKLFVPYHVPWVLTDIENDDSLFMIEIPSCEEVVCSPVNEMHSAESSSSSPPCNSGKRNSWRRKLVRREGGLESASPSNRDGHLHSENVDEELDEGSVESASSKTLSDMTGDATSRADTDDTKIRRVYFKCPGGGNEKSIWLRTALKLNRLSSTSKKRMSRRVLAPVKPTVMSRRRSERRAETAANTRRMERFLTLRPGEFKETLLLERSNHKGEDGRDAQGDAVDAEEYKVFPTWCYPHRWMTNEELTHEMLGPSSHFHDLLAERMENEPQLIEASASVAIGRLEVEVLCGIGLPKLDRFSNSDPVCYLVCGSYAFATDTINDKNNPIWPRKSRRACVFPLYHAYAQLFVGVFDDDGVRDIDDFCGRVEVDISRLRPGCTYDVTLPLRLSSEVYMRRSRGAIRLRIRLDWNSERAAVLSYLPGTDTTSALLRKRRNNEPLPAVTVRCADVKAFRNVAITLHGTHMPGKFNQKIFRSAVREFNLYRIALTSIAREWIMDVIFWRRPAVSGYVFFGWMHCVRNASVALLLPYFFGCIFFLLVRNYAKFNLNAKSHCGYAPLTFEELLASLLQGRPGSMQRFMEPLDVPAVRPSSTGSLSGGKEEDVNHQEFPFSDGKRYRKMTLDEAYNTAKKQKADSQNASVRVATTMLDLAEMRKLSLQGDFDEEEDDDERWFAKRENILDEFPEAMNAGRDVIVRGAVNTLNALGGSPSCEAKARKKVEPSNKPVTNGRKGPKERGKELFPEQTASTQTASMDPAGGAGGANSGEIKRCMRVPEQDADVVMAKKKPLKDDLVELRDKLQENSLRIFDDRVYISRNEPESMSNRSIGSVGSDASPCDTDGLRDLRKSIGLAGSTNPVTARIGEYLGPITQIYQWVNMATRATVNIFMWKDPYLSFWASIICFLLICLVAVFPWRLFLLVLGVVSVGPQNLAYRLVRDRLGAHQRLCGPVAKAGSQRKKLSAEKLRGRLSKLSGRSSCPTSPTSSTAEASAFCSHSYLVDGQISQRGDTGFFHEVVVPYSPLRRHRFYDWPPIPSASRVTVDHAESNASSRLVGQTENGTGRQSVRTIPGQTSGSTLVRMRRRTPGRP